MRIDLNDLPPWAKVVILAAEVVAIMLLAPLVVDAADQYVPLTHDQAAQYIDANREGAIEDIIAWDWVQHARADLSMPGLVFALRGRDLSWGYDPPTLVVTVPGLSTGDPPELRYSLDLRGGSKQGFAPEGYELELWLWRGAAVACAFLGYEAGRASR